MIIIAKKDEEAAMGDRWSAEPIFALHREVSIGNQHFASLSRDRSGEAANASN
jgi:hypothetical protein